MAEIVGASAAGVQLFDTAIEVFKRVRKAYRQHKDLISILDKYSLELERIRDLSETVRTEKALVGAKVSGPLVRLEELETKLSKWLAKVDPKDKTSIRRFADQLLRGQEDRKKLDDIMRDLDRVKYDLNLAIDMHQAKVSYNISQAVVGKKTGTANVSRKSIKNRSAAKGTSVVVPANRRSNTQLSDSGISSMSSDSDTSSESSNGDSDTEESTIQVPKTRIVKRNKAKKGATMINCPIGNKDLYADVQIVEIEDNECDEDAMMVNYMNDEEGLESARRQKEFQMRMMRERMLFERGEMLWRMERKIPFDATIGRPKSGVIQSG